MEEKVLNGKKNGMLVLLGWLALTVAAVVGVIFGAMETRLLLLVPGIVWLSLGWMLLPGLKVLKPQEALVLTLFGKYVGTLKGAGFFFVNPFCTAVNPAAATKLNQSGDVDSHNKTDGVTLNLSGQAAVAVAPTKKLSLKLMKKKEKMFKLSFRIIY